MKALRLSGIIILCVLALMGVLFAGLLAFGYRPIRITETTLDLNVINTIAACISTLATIAIPIIIFMLDKRMKKRANETKDVLLNELSNFKNEYEEKIRKLSEAVTITDAGDTIIDLGTI